MKQQVLTFYTKLLAHIRQPLLPHINVHRPVQVSSHSIRVRSLLNQSIAIGNFFFFYRCLPLSLFSSQKLIRLCGEVLAAPTENEEIQFLCIVCAKLKQDPYLVNFFLEVGPLPGRSPRPRPACRVPYLKTFAFSAEQVEASRGGENQRGGCGEGRRRGSGHGSVSGGGASEAPGGAAGCSGRLGLGLQSNQQQQRQQLQPRHLAA